MLARFTVQERAEKKDLNTPGGDALMKQLEGSGGLPYFAFLDARGVMVVNANRPGKDGKAPENIGYPTELFEIDWFMAMLAKAVPQMTEQERSTMDAWLRAKAKKPAAAPSGPATPKQ